MGIWITFFICGLGISISLRYLGKMLNSLIIFGFIAFAIVKLSTITLGTWLLLIGTTIVSALILSFILIIAEHNKELAEKIFTFIMIAPFLGIFLYLVINEMIKYYFW